jgi:hypothetical protein
VGFINFSFPSVLLLTFTSIILVVSRDWRFSVSALGIQYIGAFVLVGITLPLEMAVVKLVAGWIAAAILGIGMVALPKDRAFQNGSVWRGTAFRVLLALLVGFTILVIAPDLAKVLSNASYEQILGSVILMGMGILNLGVSENPFRVTIGILTFLSGFEIIFATIETSSVVAGFLAFFSLGISFIGSYILAAPQLEVGK